MEKACDGLVAKACGGLVAKVCDGLVAKVYLVGNVNNCINFGRRFCILVFLFSVDRLYLSRTLCDLYSCGFTKETPGRV